jgi:hypothetical protein
MNRHSRHFTGALVALAAAGLWEPTSASAQSAYDQPPPPPPGSAARGPSDRFQIGAQVGWLFGASVDVPNGEIGLNGNWAYTGNADFRLSPTTLIEARYTFFPTEVEFHPFFGVDEDITEIDIHYIQAGVQSELPVGIARPFVGLTLGATYFDATRSIYDNETYFSMIPNGGVKLVASEYVGMRAQASLPYTWTGSTSALFCDLGECSYGYVGNGILQLDLALGAYAMF